MPHERTIIAVIGVTSLLAVLIALTSQYLFDMAPCAWCVFQRLIYLTITTVCLLSVLLKPARLGSSLVLAAILSLCAAGVAAAWYQAQVASNSFSCVQSAADQIMTKSGLESAMPWLFGIYASCMDARVKVFGLEYAYWSLILFSLLGLVAALALANLTRQTQAK